MSEDRTVPTDLTRPLLQAVGDLQRWLAGPTAPDAQVQAWRLYSGEEWGGIYCAEPDCDCDCESSTLLPACDGEGEDAETFTLAELHEAIGGHIADRAARAGGGE